MAENEGGQGPVYAAGGGLSYHELIQRLHDVTDDPTHPDAPNLYPYCKGNWTGRKLHLQTKRVLLGLGE